MQQKVLPLTRANQFLNMITSFAGLVERFTHPNLTLYYTLTREPEAGKQVLYITLFDHKERATRVYTRDGTTEHFYSTEFDVPLIDLRHGLLETKLDNEIISEDDLIAGDPEIHSLLRIHYQSIMDQIHFTAGETHASTSTSTSTSTSPLPPPVYTIENGWTLKTADTMGARERTRLEEQAKSSRGTWGPTVEGGRTMEVDRSQPAFERNRLYLEHGQIEAMRQSLDAARGRWIDMYMEWVARQTRDRLEGETAIVRIVDGAERRHERVVRKKALGGDEELNAVVEKALIDERSLMERLHVYEVEAWEGLVWNRVKEFMDRNDVPESGKERLTREWRGNCWKRLNANIRAMDARIEHAKVKISALPSNELQSTLNSQLKGAHDDIRRDWQSVIERLVDTSMPPSSSTPCQWPRFSGAVQEHAEGIREGWLMPDSAGREQERKLDQEMARRLKKELADVEFRIAQGLDRCDRFFDDEQLLRCRHSRSKSFILDSDRIKAPLEFYFRALKGNNDLIHIQFGCFSDREYATLAKTICNIPSIASIWVYDPQRLPLIQRDTPLFIDGFYGSESLETFLDNDQSPAHNRDTYVFMSGLLSNTMAVSFVGPSSGNLILRLQHRAGEPDITLTILGTSFTFSIPESLTVDDINLHPIGNSSSQLSFTPDTRINVIIQTSSLSSSAGYTLQDLQVLDEDGNPYGQPSQHNIPATEFDTLRTPDDREHRDTKPQQESPASGQFDLLAD
jgi:hypothetical protein